MNNLAGKQFGAWLVLELAPAKHGKARWKCGCACGTIKVLFGSSLASGDSRSCGCLKGTWSPRQRERKKVPLEKRFMSHVEQRGPDECWLWTASLNDHGYGVIGVVGRKQQKAHRISWELYKGPIVSGMCVLHRCDNPPCVNPDHLFLGTMADNTADMLSKGRASKLCGENSSNAKLTTAQVLEIKASKNVPARVFMDRFDISESTVHGIKSGRYWTHLP